MKQHKKPVTCRSCPLYTQGVGFVRPLPIAQPDLLVQCRDPGHNEIDQGRPLVGKAGEWFWNQIVVQAGVNKKKVLADNTLRCLNNNNIDDYPKGALKVGAERCCRQYDQWSKHPTVPLLLMGNEAASQFYGSEINVQKMRGDIRKVGKRFVGISFHPSAVMREPNLLQTVVQDMYNLKICTERHLKEPRILKVAPVHFKPARNAYVDCDLEWNVETGEITTVGLTDGTDYAFSTHDVPAGLKALSKIIRERPDVTIVNHAWLTADEPMLEGKIPPIPLKRVFDTLCGSHAAHPHLAQKHQLDLGNMCRFYFPQTDWKSWKKDPHRLKWDERDYNGNDVARNIQMAPALMQDIRHFKQEHILERTQKLSRIAAIMKKRGIRVDRENLYRVAKKKIKDKADAKRSFPVNPESPKQVVPWVYEKFGIRIPNIQKETLQKHYGKFELLDRLIDFRDGLKGLEDWYPIEVNKKTGDVLSVGDRINPQHHATGTVVDRFSTSDPGFQNLPRTGEMKVVARNGKLVETPNKLSIYRQFMLPESKDHFLFVPDFKQIENRTVAFEAGCQKMLDLFATGVDFHRGTASEIFSTTFDDVTKAQRHQGKTVVHQTSYVGGINMLSISLAGNISHESIKHATQIRDNYFKKFPEIPEWHERIGRLVEAGEPLVNAFGRRRQIFAPDFHSMQKDGCHFLGCSDAAGIIATAIIRIYEELKLVPLLIVHDEIVMSLPKGRAGERLMRDIKEIMEQPFDEFDGMYFPVDCKIGDNYYDLKEIKVA